MLEPFFDPQGIAVIGASRDPHKPGYGIVRNLMEVGYQGAIHPVNPSAAEIMGNPCYAAVTQVPEPVDLAVVIVPARKVIDTVAQCVDRGIGHVIVASGGFGETGEEGRALEQELGRMAAERGVRIIGPNCIGTIDTYSPLDTTFTVGRPRPGNIGFVSQSGALVVILINLAQDSGVGFSRIVSLGNQLDVNETDILASLGSDPHTQVVAGYLEGVADGRSFMQVAEDVSRRKPVVILKAGHSAGGAKAVTSHTGVLAGSAEAYEAAFRRSGVLQMSSTEDLFDWARTLAWQPLPQGNRIAVLTNAGGTAILTADALETAGLELAAFGEETRARLQSVLPPAGCAANPVDVLAGSGSGVYAVALDALLQDPGVDAAVVVVAPQDWFQVSSLAEVIAELSSLHKKPVLTSLMGLSPDSKALEILNQWRVPNFNLPEKTAPVLAAMVARREWLEKPVEESLDLEETAVSIPIALSALDKQDWPEMLSSSGIAVPVGRLARTGQEAATLAKEIGYPVVLKLVSPQITHKSDVGGVVLNLNSAESVRLAFQGIIESARKAQPQADIEGVLVQKMLGGGQELIVGIRRDPQFGPLVLVGSGGTEVELLRDVAVDIAPVTYAQAGDLLDATRAGVRMKGWRGGLPGDRSAVLDVIVRIAQLACDFPSITELEINPLYVLSEGQGAVAVDVRGHLD